VVIALREIAARRPFRAAGDFLVSPTYVPDLVHATLDLLIDDAAAVWHLANRGGVSWAELARRAVTLAGLDPALVVECSGASLGWAAPRPAFSVLGSERGQLLPDLDDALTRYMRDRRPEGDSAAGERPR
jgi:dTDP-4-dehydrorhamnose reductase